MVTLGFQRVLKGPGTRAWNASAWSQLRMRGVFQGCSDSLHLIS